MFNIFILYILIFVSCGYADPGYKQLSSAYKDSSISKDGSSGGDGKYFELLEKIKGLESEVQALNRSRSDLEQRVQTSATIGETNAKTLTELSGKVRDVEASVDLDANYWNSTEKCGGVIISQFGKISYSQSHSRLYSTAVPKFSSCIWTGFETIVPPEKINTILRIVPFKSYLFNGPVILISILLRTGAASVSVVFEGVGMQTHQDMEFKHYHFDKTIGNFNQMLNQSYADPFPQSPVVPKKRTFSTVVINAERSNLAELQINPEKGCQNATLRIHYGTDLQPENIPSCCSGTCPSKVFYSLEGWFAASYSGSDSLGLQWTSQLNQSDSIDRCGGVVMGRIGKISYKRSSNYFNNERCVWVIYPFPKSAVRITNVITGMESTYDHLVITEIDKKIPESIPISGLSNIRNFTGRVVLVTFFTDSSVVRQGFDFTWEATGPADNSRKLANEFIVHNKPSEFNNRISIRRTASPAKGFNLYLMSSLEQDGSSLGMTLYRKSSDCTNTTVKLFGSHGGHIGNFYSNIERPCSDATAGSLSSPDGIGSVFIESQGLQKDVEFEVGLQQFPPDTSDISIGDECGGILHASSGRISYKLEEIYANNERCIWIIHNPSSAEIELKLLKDGFEECCDYILVNRLNPDNGTLLTATSILTKTNNTMVFPGPILVVTFRTDSSVVGKGFALQYTGKGSLTGHPYTYKIVHREEPSGAFEYPEKSSWDNGMEENELLVVAYSNQVDGGEGSALVNFNVTIEKVVLGMDANCNMDVLNFYSSPSRDGFHWAESYPKHKCSQNDQRLCTNCMENNVNNDTSRDAFGSAFKAFLAIYKPVKSEFTNQSFQAHWDVAAGCGGVLYQTTGRIAYKLGGKYKNSEQCIWTINAPDTARIAFTLQTNGFESCCDYIILNSLIVGNGTLGAPRYLRGDERFITMDGPVVFVTFRSDGSVTGEGFSLTFTETSGGLSSNTTESELPSYFFNHVHGKRRNSSFSFPVNDDDFELDKEHILTFTYSPETTKNESFLRYGTKVTIDAAHLGINNETCTSDTLTFFDTPSRLGYNVTKSFALQTPENPTCHFTQFPELLCKECPTDQSKAQQLTISSSYPAFIMIWKSHSDSSSGPHPKSLRMAWNDLSKGTPAPAY